jgi:ACT domain-containing protein
MKDDSILIEYLGDTPKLRILNFLLENRLFDYSKKQLIDETGISRATFYKYWGELVEHELVIPTRSFGKTTLYKINEKSTFIRKLKSLIMALIEETTPKPEIDAPEPS